MAIRPILTLENPVLRQKSKRIKRIDKSIDGKAIGTPDELDAALVPASA